MAELSATALPALLSAERLPACRRAWHAYLGCTAVFDVQASLDRKEDLRLEQASLSLHTRPRPRVKQPSFPLRLSSSLNIPVTRQQIMPALGTRLAAPASSTDADGAQREPLKHRHQAYRALARANVRVWGEASLTRLTAGQRRRRGECRHPAVTTPPLTSSLSPLLCSGTRSAPVRP